MASPTISNRFTFFFVVLWCVLLLNSIKADEIVIKEPKNNTIYKVGDTVPISSIVKYNGIALIKSITIETKSTKRNKTIENDVFTIERKDFNDKRAFATNLFLDPTIYRNDEWIEIRAIGHATYIDVNIKKKVNHNILSLVQIKLSKS
ncbi:hypothetical protein G9A89_017548 [Geosiphon pyriformis]|nr:hypothetical protein G9A89_017548 [Geosiphon pyriformis]